MEALMLSVMLAICAQTGLPMPNPPIGIAYAPQPFDADPPVRYDAMERAILLDVAWNETDPEHRALLAETLTTVIKGFAATTAKAPAAPEPVGHGVIAVRGSVAAEDAGGSR
jgi:hypothetical protein